MLDLLENAAIDNRDYVTMRLDEIISTNSLSQPNSLYMVRDSSEIDSNIENKILAQLKKYGIFNINMSLE
jgi:hypothetical protein